MRSTGLRRCRRLWSSLAALPLGIAVLATAPAFAGEDWQGAGSGAVAILPVPAKASGVVGGSLVCAEQRWALRLRTGPRDDIAPSVEARLVVDDMAFPVEAAQESTLVSLPVSADMLEALKSGTRLAVNVGAALEPSATFPLRGSRKVIEAAAALCSQVDMSAYDKVALSEADTAVETVAPLLADEVELFRAATTATPKLAAARLDRGGGREMLFASLCGSSWYYGRTGCTLFGFLQEAAGADWREAYNSEGLDLYLDPNASKDGWPNLVTLERSGGVEPLHWLWNGERYELRDPLVAADEDASPDTVTP